jgi:hypothetical protein
MRRRLWSFVLLNAIAVCALAVSPPQYSLQRTLKGSIGASPLVTVGDVQAVGEAYLVNVRSSIPEVARGLSFILTKEYNFGGIRLSIRVLDGEGKQVDTPDTPATGDAEAESKRHFEAALAHNPLFVRIVGGGFFYTYALEIEPAIVQFWNDNIGDPHGNTNLIAADAFQMVCRETLFGGQVRPSWSTASMQSSFGDEGILPAVAHSTGLHGSAWTTDLWILSAGATSVELWFHPVNRDNTNVTPVTLSLTTPVTPLSDVVATLFRASGTGALRYRANGPVRVIGRTSSPSVAGGTSAQLETGISLRSAARGGSDGRALSMIIDQRLGFRVNLGLINAQAATATVQVRVFAADGTPVEGFGTLTATLPPFGVAQLNDLLARLTTDTRAGLIVQVRVVSAEGALIAYLCDVDNTTNDPTYQEAFLETGGR